MLQSCAILLERCSLFAVLRPFFVFADLTADGQYFAVRDLQAPAAWQALFGLRSNADVRSTKIAVVGFKWDSC